MKHVVLLLSFVILCAAGCGEVGLKGLSPVKGKLIFGGEPVDGIIISLTPSVPSPQNPENRSATARTAANGTFKLRTLKTDDGAFPGEYKVSFSKVATSLTPQQTSELVSLGVREPITEVKETVPAKYRSAATSGITLTVTAGKNSDWIVDIPEGLEKVTFSPRSTFEAQKPKGK